MSIGYISTYFLDLTQMWRSDASLTSDDLLQVMIYIDSKSVRDRPKLFWNQFRIMFPAYYHSIGPYESAGTKSFEKLDQKIVQNQSRSYLVQKNAIFTELKYEIGFFDSLKW